MSDQTRQTHQTEPSPRSNHQVETVEPEQPLELGSGVIGAIQTPTLGSLTPGVVLQLQRLHGNQFVSNLLAQARETSGTAVVQRDEENAGSDAIGTDEENPESCHVDFNVIGPDPVQGGATNNSDGTKNIRIRGHFRINVQLPDDCSPGEFQYRQFIQGTATLTRGSTVEDIAHFWRHIPGGQLPSSFQEDGNTTWPSPNYGHRDQPGQATTTATRGENHYTDPDGTENQTSGSIYHGEDFPDVTIEGVHSGDVLNIHVNFRGEIHRNGHAITSLTRRWTAVNLTNFTLD